MLQYMELNQYGQECFVIADNCRDYVNQTNVTHLFNVTSKALTPKPTSKNQQLDAGMAASFSLRCRNFQLERSLYLIYET